MAKQAKQNEEPKKLEDLTIEELREEVQKSHNQNAQLAIKLDAYARALSNFAFQVYGG